MKKEIKELYDQLNHKGNFILKLSEKVQAKPSSIQRNWFTSNPFTKIPQQHEALVKKMLLDEIKRQA